uniref:Uncharacterized protein n=1 Tax=Anopheles christyi TaxID=43041 RepID=A0A182KIP9_9DIPT
MTKPKICLEIVYKKNL